MIAYKTKKGGDIGKVLSKIPIELHMRDTSLRKYSFCGPNTDLEKRLNPDDTPKDCLNQLIKLMQYV